MIKAILFVTANNCALFQMTVVTTTHPELLGVLVVAGTAVVVKVNGCSRVAAAGRAHRAAPRKLSSRKG